MLSKICDHPFSVRETAANGKAGVGTESVVCNGSNVPFLEESHSALGGLGTLPRDGCGASRNPAGLEGEGTRRALTMGNSWQGLASSPGVPTPDEKRAAPPPGEPGAGCARRCGGVSGELQAPLGCSCRG